MKTLLAFALWTGAALAQSAQVQPLTPGEADAAKRVYAARDVANKAVEDWDNAIRRKYLQAEPHTQGSGQQWFKSGADWTKTEGKDWFWVKPYWGNGQFEYDKTFSFIVPVTPKATPAPYSNGNFYINPVNKDCPFCANNGNSPLITAW